MGLTLQTPTSEAGRPQGGQSAYSLAPPPCSPGHREVRVIDTDYERYAILRLSLHWQDKDVHVLKYFSKLSQGGGSALRPPAGPLLSLLPHSPQPRG